MSNIALYANSLPILLDTTNLLLQVFDNHEARETELKLQGMKTSLQQMAVAGTVLSSGIQSLTNACSLAIDSFIKLQAFRITAQLSLQEQKNRQEFFLNFIKPLVEQCENMIKNNNILIDTSHLDETDREAAIKIRNLYFEMQTKYLNALNILI